MVADRYVVVRRLGSGGRGRVYLARDVSNNDLVAIKVARSLRFSRTLLSSARALAGIAHRGLCAYRSSGQTTDGLAFLVTDWVDGLSVLDMIDEHPFAIRDALTVGCIVAEVLALLHRTGYMHRDIKPSNVLIPHVNDKPSFDHARVIDFDIAIPTESDSASYEAALFGTILGTPVYMAPEQLSGRHLTPAVDIFALGATLHAMIYEEPFGGSEDDLRRAEFPEGNGPRPFVGEYVIRRLTQPVELPGVAGVPTSLENLLRAMLDIDPRNRPTADFVASELQRISIQLGRLPTTTHAAASFEAAQT